MPMLLEECLRARLHLGIPVKCYTGQAKMRKKSKYLVSFNHGKMDALYEKKVALKTAMP